MANAFKRKVSRNVSAATTVGGYTVAAATQVTVIGLAIAARNNAQATVTVELWNGAAAVATIIEGASVPPGDTLVVVGAEQKLVMEPGDFVKVTATAGAVDVIMSILEMI